MYANRGALTPDKAYELFFALTGDANKALNAQAEVLLASMPPNK